MLDVSLQKFPIEIQHQCCKTGAHGSSGPRANWAVGSRVPTRKSWISRSNAQHLIVPFTVRTIWFTAYKKSYFTQMIQVCCLIIRYCLIIRHRHHDDVYFPFTREQECALVSHSPHRISRLPFSALYKWTCPLPSFCYSLQSLYMRLNCTRSCVVWLIDSGWRRASTTSQ
jgi:hypothetical protein